LCGRPRLGSIPQIQVTERQTIDPLGAPAHVEAAVEAGCETSFTLQLLSARESAPDRALQLLQAIDTLRGVIAGRREMANAQAGVLTLGFVVGVGPGLWDERKTPPVIQARF
jgi:hypothetical protein